MKKLTLATLALCCASGLAFAQSPGGGGDADPVDNIQQAKPAKTKTARQVAQEVIRGKGWKPGYDKNSGKLVIIGESVISAGPDEPLDFGDSRAMAYEEAMMDAKQKMAEAMAVEIEASAMSSSMSRRSSKPKGGSDGSAAAPKEAPGTLDKLQKLAGSYLDEALVNRGIDPDGDPAEVEKAVKEIRRSKEFKSGMKAAAMTELGGVFAYQVFEQVAPGKRGQMAVIAMTTPKSKQMAQAFLGLGEAPTGKAKSSNYDYVEGEGDALVYAFGVRPRTDENGELCLLSFGQSTAEDDDDWSFEDAQGFAEDTAMMNLRFYCGEALSSERESSRGQSLKQFADKSEEYTNTSTRREKAESEAALLSMPGMIDIYSAKVYHPLCNGVPTAVVVYEYKLSAARELAELAQEFAQTSGSQGGAGVTGSVANKPADEEGAKGGSKAGPRGGNSGSSSGADDDDL
jgi:hypothetical protein